MTTIAYIYLESSLKQCHPVLLNRVFIIKQSKQYSNSKGIHTVAKVHTHFINGIQLTVYTLHVLQSTLWYATNRSPFTIYSSRSIELTQLGTQFLQYGIANFNETRVHIHIEQHRPTKLTHVRSYTNVIYFFLCCSSIYRTQKRISKYG